MTERGATAAPPSPGVAVVTGAGRGLGEAIALHLAAAGWDLGLVARSQEQLDHVADRVGRVGPRVAVASADVRDRDAIEEAFGAIANALGGIHALVNNAGVQRVGPALEVTRDDWEVILATNLTGAFNCMQAAAPQMIAGGRGAIVNICSVAGQVAVADRAPYAASKAGLLILTRACALEWAPLGIRVNAVSPTFVDTDLARQTLDQPGAREQILARIPLGRLATTTDVSAAVAFLLDDDRAGFVTGENLTVDGGFRA